MRSPTDIPLLTPYETLFDWENVSRFPSISHGSDTLKVDRVFCGRKVELDRETGRFRSQVLGLAFLFSSDTLPTNVAKRRGNRLAVGDRSTEENLFKRTPGFKGFEAYPKTAIPFSIVHHSPTGSILCGDLELRLTHPVVVGSSTLPEPLSSEEIEPFLAKNLPSIMSQAFFHREGWQLALASAR